MFERMQWRAKRKLHKGVQQMLLAAPAKVPFPEKWWPIRNRYIRKAIEDKNYRLALKLAKNHGQVSGVELAEALWLSGWLKFVYVKDAKGAYEDFYKLFKGTQYPISKARASYWAARAARAHGTKEISDNWFKQASRYPTTFYGQMALVQRKEDMKLPEVPKAHRGIKRTYRNSELIAMSKLLFALKEDKQAFNLLKHLVGHVKNNKEVVAIMEVAESFVPSPYRVRLGKEAIKRGVYYTKLAYPQIALTKIAQADKPLALAIARQESEFDRYAKSNANARGLMQLLPSTAKQVAKKAGIRYNRSKLYSPQYNAKLGTLYATELKAKYDESILLMSAGYNAGPANVNSWINATAYLNTSLYDRINWIERIPFRETRSYVQRVFENYQVYKFLTDGVRDHKAIKRDIIEK
jgi:soluble lytic murein transglycosylase